jgi:hypothetical protein
VGKRLRMDLGEGEEIPPTKVLVVPAAAPRTARMVEMLLGERTNT